MSTVHKYYWLKLKRDFFKRHDVKIVESLENGKDYLLFYLKLLVESIDHEGNLRFSETIPYDEKMLSTITDTNIDIVRSACKVFSELGMMERFDDGTLFMSHVEKMIGSETSEAIRKRDERAKQLLIEQQNGGQCPKVSKKRPPELELELELELDIDKELDIEIDKDNNTDKSSKHTTPQRFKIPTIEEVRQYCDERKNSVDPERFVDFYSSKGWLVGKSPMKDWRAAVRTWEPKDKPNSQAREPPKKELIPCPVCHNIPEQEKCDKCGFIVNSETVGDWELIEIYKKHIGVE